MSRIWIVRLWCVTFALLHASGVHAHRLGDAHAPHNGHAVAHDSIPHHESGAHATIDAGHAHLHSAHGAVDVESPANAFGKSPASKTALFVLAWTSSLFVPTQLTSPCRHLATADPPATHCWYPHYLPQNHAPPRTA